MPTNDPKQAIIDSLSDPQFRREERGCLAEIETLLFLKEKSVPNLQAYVVSYMSTTKQKWNEACCVINTTNSLWEYSRGFRTKNENQFVTTEDDRVRYGSQPWMKLSATKEIGYWFLYGRIISNGHPITSVRMIPGSGQVEEDDVHDGFVLFLSKCSLPVEFEFYNPSLTLLGKQLWGTDTSQSGR